jgi:hypothetical protein
MTSAEPSTIEQTNDTDELDEARQENDGGDGRSLAHIQRPAPIERSRYPRGMTGYLQRWHEMRLGQHLMVPMEVGMTEDACLMFLVDHSPFGTYESEASEIPLPHPYTISEQHQVFAQLRDEGFVRSPLPPLGKYLRDRIRHLNLLHAASGFSPPFERPKLANALKRLRAFVRPHGQDHPTRLDEERKSARPIEESAFQALVNACSDDASGLRDRALIYFVRHVGLFAAEQLRLLQVQHLLQGENGQIEVDLLSAGIAPLNKLVSPLNNILSGAASEAMSAWLRTLNRRLGAVFVNTGEGTRASRALAITTPTIAAILRRRSATAGLPTVWFRTLPLDRSNVWQPQRRILRKPPDPRRPFMTDPPCFCEFAPRHFADVDEL